MPLYLAATPDRLAQARSQGIRDALVMLPEVEDILVPLFAGEA